MKRDYRKPLVEKIEFEYSNQVVAESVRYCDQGWTQITNLDPLATCDTCYKNLIWLNTLSPI